jgi:DNA-binding response OmpR family regulator
MIMTRILILDDEADLGELYRMALEAAGYEVVGIFDDPQVPLSRPPPELDPDVIVLDERLRGLSGISFLPRLRATFPRARILFASADPDAVERALRESADAAKKKPFSLGELVAEVRVLMETR